MKATVSISVDEYNPFQVRQVVRQGCVIVPTLFGLFLTAVLLLMRNITKGVYIKTHRDGKLFNLSQLRAASKCRRILIRELLYADDTALIARYLSEIQELVNSSPTRPGSSASELIKGKQRCYINQRLAFPTPILSCVLV